MSKKYLISLLYILLFSLALQLSLADFQVVITPVADEINIEESASFDLYVVNLGRATDSYELSFTNDGSWSIETDPLAHLSGFSLDAGESKTTAVVLTPTSLLKPSKYTFPFSVVTDSGEEQSFELFINDQYQQYNTVPIISDNGSIDRILSVSENITARKNNESKIENTLRSSEKQRIANLVILKDLNESTSKLRK